MPATPKKAPRKRATPARNTDRATEIDAFEAFRARARAVDLPTPTTPDQLIIGREHGFDPPLTATWPKTAVGRSALDLCTRSMDVNGILWALLGPQQVLRVASRFESHDAAEVDQLMAGLAIYILEHMIGPGAGDVPGGTRASSTS
ncbi:hypothetical protein [Nocardia puris]|uniref:hypothetical protein n=1 Tax=Nocardia puris TaxID=208602 RepID=UPI002E227DDF